MAYRYTSTDKWSDQWFSDLKPTAKLLFMYLCDQCDIAGFLELNEKKLAFDTGIDKQGIGKAMKEIEGRVIFSIDLKYIFIKNFIKHQKNFPLNPSNNAHKGIIERLNEKLEVFGYENVKDFFNRGYLGANEGLQSPYGNSNGKGNSNGSEEKGGMGEKETWRCSFDVYKTELRLAYQSIVDEEFVSERQIYHPNINIRLTIQKAIKDYWVTETGWKKKKASATVNIDWKTTFKKVLDQKYNHVYLDRNDHSASSDHGIGVWVENGKKYYGSKTYPVEIPMNAPKRTESNSVYYRSHNKWMVE